MTAPPISESYRGTVQARQRSQPMQRDERIFITVTLAFLIVWLGAVVALATG